MQLSEVNSKNMELIRDKEKLITNSINISNELNMMRDNLKNSTTIIEHNCKVNAIMKEEKEALAKSLRESEEKLSKINNGQKKLKVMMKYLKQENDDLNNKQNSLCETNKNLLGEKEECVKVTSLSRTCLSY